MKLSTGKVAFPIEFDNGDKEVIYFNPNDPDLIFRMRDFGKKVTEKVKDIEDIELNDEGNPIDSAKIKAFEKAQNILKVELDYAFGGDISSKVFKHCSPFAIIGDNYFVIQFIEAISPEIEKSIKKANSDAEKRMSKRFENRK